MPRLLSLASLAVACLLAAGCSSSSGNSAGVGFGAGSEVAPDPRTSTLVLSVGEDATWRESESAPRQPLEAGVLLPEGAVVESSGKGGVELRLPGEAGTLSLTSRTRITLADLGEEGSMEIWVTDGRVEGRLTAGRLRLRNVCGGFLAVSPMPGMTASFSFGDTMTEEMWDAVIGLGLNPGSMQSTLTSRGALEQVPQAVLTSVKVPTAVPEPSSLLLALLGAAGAAAAVRRRRPDPR